MSLEQNADHCAEVMLSIVRGHLATAPEVWADLTDGFDSRMVVAALMRAGVH